MRNLFFITALLVFSVPVAAQQQVYRWVDDKGMTHFGAKPPEGANAEQVSSKKPPLLSGSSSAATAPEKSEVGMSNPANAINNAQQQALDGKAQDDAAEEEAERVKFCEETREMLAQLRNNPRLSYTDDEGEVHRLTEEARQQRITDAESYIADICK